MEASVIEWHASSRLITMIELHAWLSELDPAIGDQRIGNESYAALLVREGYGSTGVIRDATCDELWEVGVKRPHAKARR